MAITDADDAAPSVAPIDRRPVHRPQVKEHDIARFCWNAHRVFKAEAVGGQVRGSVWTHDVL